MPLTAGPDFSPLRLQQLFGTLQSLQQPSQVNTQAAGVPPQNDIISQLLNYQPETQASQALMGHISSMPERQDYPPSSLRQIGSVLSGLGAGVQPLGIAGGSVIGLHGTGEGMKAAEQFRNIPYTRALGDWEQKVKPLEAAAANERGQNLNMRSLLLGTASRDIQQQKADTYVARVRALEQENISKDEKRKADAKRDQARLEVYQHIANGGVLTHDETGKTYMVYKDGTKKDIGIDTFSPQELEKLRQEGRLKVVAAQGAEQRKTETEVKQPGRIELKETVPGKTVKTPENDTPNEAARRQVNIAEAYKRSHPEHAKWIKISGLNVEITPPGKKGLLGSSSGPTEEEYNQIKLGLSTRGDISLPPPAKKPAVKKQEKDPDEVMILDSTGKHVGYINKKYIDRLPPGYTVK